MNKITYLPSQDPLHTYLVEQATKLTEVDLIGRIVAFKVWCDAFAPIELDLPAPQTKRDLAEHMVYFSYLKYKFS